MILNKLLSIIPNSFNEPLTISTIFIVSILYVKAIKLINSFVFLVNVFSLITPFGIEEINKSKSILSLTDKPFIALSAKLSSLFKLMLYLLVSYTSSRFLVIYS